VQEEICQVIEATGHTLSEESTQLNQAMQSLKSTSPTHRVGSILETRRNRHDGIEVNIPGVTPLDLDGMTYVEFFLTLVFTLNSQEAFDYLSVKQEFVKVAGSFLNTSSFGRTSFDCPFPITSLSGEGRLTLYPESLSRRTCLCPKCHNQYFEFGRRAKLRFIQINHKMRQP
jgi:hypothetical protein